MFLIVSSRHFILSALAISIGLSVVPVEDKPDSVEASSDTTGTAAEDFLGFRGFFVFFESEEPSLEPDESLSEIG